jgi:hypothetical protein
MAGWRGTIALCAIWACSFPPPQAGLRDGGNDALGDDASIDAPALPVTSIALSFPAYVGSGSAVAWHANLAGPALAELDYAIAIGPGGAATSTPGAGATALGSDGTLRVDGTLTGGATPELATIAMRVTGDTVGSAATTLPIVRLENVGDTGGDADDGDATVNGGRLVAVPLHLASGTQIVGFGYQARSTVEVQLALYGATAGTPGALLAQSPVIQPQIGTVVSYFTEPQTIPSDAAFIAVVTASTTELLEDLASADDVTQYGVNATFGAALPSPFGTATTFSQGPYAIFVVVIAP